MEMRPLGSSGMEASAVSLGCWAMGGWWWGPSDDEASVAAIHRAIDLGVNLIDTAPAYGFGHSEKIVGRAIKGRRERVVLATKCGLIWDRQDGTFFFQTREGRKIYRNLKGESVRREVEESLRRLGTDAIDLYQCHWPDPGTPAGEAMETMVALQREGKIRAIGVSNFTIEMIEECLQVGPVQSLQPRYSMLDRRIEEDLLPYCERKRIGVIAYSPLEQGILTGKVTPARRFPEGDERRQQPWFKEKNLPRVLAFLERIRPIAEAHGKTLAQLAISWVLARDGVTSAIVGARGPEQVDENAGGAGWRPSDEEMRAIDRHLCELGGLER